MKFRRGFHHTEPMPLNTAMAWSKINLYDEKEVISYYDSIHVVQCSTVISSVIRLIVV